MKQLGVGITHSFEQAGLPDEAGVAAAAAVVTQLCLLYDGAMVAAHLDPGSGAAASARAAASVLVRA